MVYSKKCIICDAPWGGVGVRCNSCQQTELLKQQAKKARQQAAAQQQIVNDKANKEARDAYGAGGAAVGELIMGSLGLVLGTPVVLFLVYVLICAGWWWIKFFVLVFPHLLMGLSIWPDWTWIGF